MEHTGSATIIYHCAIFGRSETKVRYFKIDEPRPGAQRPTCLFILIREIGKRRGAGLMVCRDDSAYATIEVDGKTVWDSRSVIPCDMEKWEAENQRHQGKRPFSTSRA